MKLLAPAKINLHLRVGPLGADGYVGFHPLVSWMVTVGLFDTLIIDHIDRTDRSDAAAGDVSGRSGAGNTTATADEIRFACDDTSLPTDDRNLVVRAAKMFLAPHRRSVVSIELRKVIPYAAGLGGG